MEPNDLDVIPNKNTSVNEAYTLDFNKIYFNCHLESIEHFDDSGADLGAGCRGCAKKKTVWFIGVEVEQETSTPPPKKNPGSAPIIEVLLGSLSFSPGV